MFPDPLFCLHELMPTLFRTTEHRKRRVRARHLLPLPDGDLIFLSQSFIYFLVCSLSASVRNKGQVLLFA